MQTYAHSQSQNTKAFHFQLFGKLIAIRNDTKQNEIKVAVCDASGTHLAYGVGSTRKKAEQMACREALSGVSTDHMCS